MKILLGYEQTASLDGQVLEGTTDFDIDIDAETTNVTPPGHATASHLVIRSDWTISIAVKWAETYEKLSAKFNKHPPEPMTLSISNVASIPVVMVGAPVRVPLAGLVGWQVRLKPWFLGP